MRIGHTTLVMRWWKAATLILLALFLAGVGTPSRAVLPGDVTLEWMDAGTDPVDIALPLSDFPGVAELLAEVLFERDIYLSAERIEIALEGLFGLAHMMGLGPAEGSTIHVNFTVIGLGWVSATYSVWRDIDNVPHVDLTSVGPMV